MTSYTDVKLRSQIDVVELLQTVKKCQEDIFFISKEGDVLNLNSQLASYVFIASIQEEALIEDGYLRVTAKDDLFLLSPFLRADGY